MEPTVLLVEDYADLRTLLADHLREEGMRVMEAGDAVQASTIAVEHRPDVIVLDVMLPGSVDGLELARRFRRHDATRDAPIIILSDVLFASDRERAESAGAAAVLTKPFLPEELAARVQALLKR